MELNFCCVVEPVDSFSEKIVVGGSSLLSEVLVFVCKLQRSYSLLEPLFSCCQSALIQCNLVSFLLDWISFARWCSSRSYVMSVRMLQTSLLGYQYVWAKLEVLRRLFSLIALVSLFCFSYAASLCYLFVGGSKTFRYFGSEVVSLLVSAFALGHFVAGGGWILPWLPDVLLLCVLEEILRRSFYFKALDFQISLRNLLHFC